MVLDGKLESPKRIMREAFERFGERIAISCSFGKDSVTVLHMALELNPQVPVIYVNTGLDFPETLEFRDRLVREWGLNIQEYQPTPENVAYRNSLDPELHLSNPDLCCDLLKSEPTIRALKGVDAWIVGLRRDETAFRADLRPFEDLEQANGSTLVRVAPIYDWTEDEVWEYIRTYQLPYHPVYDQGYRSMGCMPCSQAGQWGRFERAGRWSGFDKQECGMHTILRRRAGNLEELKLSLSGSSAVGEDTE